MGKSMTEDLLMVSALVERLYFKVINPQFCSKCLILLLPMFDTAVVFKLLKKTRILENLALAIWGNLSISRLLSGDEIKQYTSKITGSEMRYVRYDMGKFCFFWTLFLKCFLSAQVSHFGKLYKSLKVMEFKNINVQLYPKNSSIYFSHCYQCDTYHVTDF